MGVVSSARKVLSAVLILRDVSLVQTLDDLLLGLIITGGLCLEVVLVVLLVNLLMGWIPVVVSIVLNSILRWLPVLLHIARVIPLAVHLVPALVPTLGLGLVLPRLLDLVLRLLEITGNETVAVLLL